MFDIPEWLHDYLMKFKKDQIIEIMADALNQMQQWNGRSMTFCIVSSIEGATWEETETDTGGYIYQLPKKGKK